MPTYEWSRRFGRDFDSLTRAQQQLFLGAITQFVEDLKLRREIRKSLRVKGIQGAPGVFEMTWAPDGRATFSYGSEEVEDEPHIIWRRIGSHEIFNHP